MASRIDAIDAVVVDVVAACRAAGVDDKACRFTVPLVLTEILANAIESGNGGDATRSVRLVVRESALGLELEVADEGAGFDIAAERTTPESEGWFEGERGRGLFIISALTARVESLRTPAGGVVRVTLKPS
ncbi:MAG: ATP-binding protein [Gemmatimonadaceae bacterium]|jgi:anti-sigma regulatory factor (Ser/Thr protein kinase)|nr:ATP-binding protein [Gemmatimonadaceae bacterium]